MIKVFCSKKKKIIYLPGMVSSLSSVPPVKPSPRPETIGTFNPQAAKAGARILFIQSEIILFGN
jgi:hypothetical protein